MNYVEIEPISINYIPISDKLKAFLKNPDKFDKSFLDIRDFYIHDEFPNQSFMDPIQEVINTLKRNNVTDSKFLLSESDLVVKNSREVDVSNPAIPRIYIYSRIYLKKHFSNDPSATAGYAQKPLKNYDGFIKFIKQLEDSIPEYRSKLNTELDEWKGDANNKLTDPVTNKSNVSEYGSELTAFIKNRISIVEKFLADIKLSLTGWKIEVDAKQSVYEEHCERNKKAKEEVAKQKSLIEAKEEEIKSIKNDAYLYGG